MGLAVVGLLVASACSDDEAAEGPATSEAPAVSSGAPGATAPGGALGPTSLPDPTGDVPVVLTETVTAARQGTWWAQGLIRNDGASTLAGAVVVGHLVGPDGQEVRAVEAEVPVGVVAPGEPAPFRVEADVATAAVAEVRWEVRGTSTDAAPVALELGVFWTRPYGEDRPVSVPGYEDPDVAPLPFVLYGAATNAGADPLEAPGVVAAWLGPDGRVVALADAPVLVAGTDEPAPSLAPGESLDVVLTVDDPEAGPAMDEATPMFWGVSR